MSDEFVAYVGDPIFMTARHAMTHIRRQERDDDKSIHGNLGSPSVTASTRPAPSEFSDALKGRRVGRFVRLRIPGMYTADGRNHASPCGESHGTASSDGPKPRRCSSAVGRCGPDGVRRTPLGTSRHGMRQIRCAERGTRRIGLYQRFLWRRENRLLPSSVAAWVLAATNCRVKSVWAARAASSAQRFGLALASPRLRVSLA